MTRTDVAAFALCSALLHLGCSKDEPATSLPDASSDQEAASDSEEETKISPSAPERQELAAAVAPVKNAHGEIATGLTSETLEISFSPSEESLEEDSPLQVKDLQVSVVGPGGESRSSHPADEPVSISILGDDGEPMPDGLYKYEVMAQRELANGAVPTSNPTAPTTPNGRWADSPAVAARKDLPSTPIKRGTFRIVNGEIVQPQTESEKAE